MHFQLLFDKFHGFFSLPKFSFLSRHFGGICLFFRDILSKFAFFTQSFGEIHLFCGLSIKFTFFFSIFQENLLFYSLLRKFALFYVVFWWNFYLPILCQNSRSFLSSLTKFTFLLQHLLSKFDFLPIILWCKLIFLQFKMKFVFFSGF